MSEVYQVTVNSTVYGQTVSNIFYYGLADGTSVVAGTTAMEIVANNFITTHCQDYRTLLTSQGRIESIKIRVVNELREPISLWDYDESVDLLGLNTQPLGSVGATGILTCRCVPYYTTQTYRVPKRSYLALPPVGEPYVDPGGKLTNSYLLLANAFGDKLVNDPIGTLGGVDLISVRVGVENKVGIGAMGRLESAFVRPYVSNRRSRTLNPRGY